MTSGKNTIQNSNKEKGWRLENSYTQLPKPLYTRVALNPVPRPELVILNDPVAVELGLDSEYLRSSEGIEILTGNRVPQDATPIAQAYAGHQFGHFTMLGDGRAMLIGEQITPSGKRVDIQLKGSGRTPYSRGGDGRAALGPMLRECIISEAMHSLGIPTTRSLAVTVTGEPVYRETVLPGAVLTRVAESHIRVGTFQFISRWGTEEELIALSEYTKNRHFEKDITYPDMLKEVVRRQASLIAKWQLVGFIHGVMNTDNMAISGETIDYGPCAFMDGYDPATVFSSIDVNGRYAYGNQPEIARWNLAQLARTLLPLLNENKGKAIDLAEEALSEFDQWYPRHWLTGMRSKLGLFNEEDRDEALVRRLLEIMQKYGADFTNTFRSLSMDRPEETALHDTPEFVDWLGLWKHRLDRQPESKAEVLKRMRKANPSVIPRNHRVEEALEAAVANNDLSVMNRLLKVLSEPFAYSREQEEYTVVPDLGNCGYRTYCGT